MFGWRIRGRWSAGPASGEESFALGTRTQEREEMRARALAVLCGLAVRQSRTEKVTVEILEVEELGVIRAGGELVAA